MTTMQEKAALYDALFDESVLEFHKVLRHLENVIPDTAEDTLRNLIRIYHERNLAHDALDWDNVKLVDDHFVYVEPVKEPERSGLGDVWNQRLGIWVYNPEQAAILRASYE